MLGKPRIWSLFLNSLNKFNKNEHLYKILHIRKPGQIQISYTQWDHQQTMKHQQTMEQQQTMKQQQTIIIFCLRTNSNRSYQGALIYIYMLLFILDCGGLQLLCKIHFFRINQDIHRLHVIQHLNKSY